MTRAIFLMGVSGSGKTTVQKYLTKKDSIVYIPSYSTRAMRVNDGEKQGSPYWFISEQEFLAAKETGEFLEWAYVHNKAYYGTKRKDITQAIEEGKRPIKEFDIQGLQYLHKYQTLDTSQYMSIFLNIDEITMTERILKRQPDIDADELQSRLQSAENERSHMELCDYVVDASASVPVVVDEVTAIVEQYMQ